MSQTLTISDDLYATLAERARRHGVSIEDLLRMWPDDTRTDGTDEGMQARRYAVQCSSALYEQLAARYGTFPDSTGLLRDDRAR